MTIRYKCEECGAVLNIKDELAGTLGHCPRCKVESSRFRAPEDDEDALTDKKPVTAAGKCFLGSKGSRWREAPASATMISRASWKLVAPAGSVAPITECS